MVHTALVTEMRGWPVINARTGDRLGRVGQVTLDRALRHLTGFRLRCGGVFDRRWRLAALQDVTDMHAETIVVPDDVALREDERQADMAPLSHRQLSVHSESGELLGHVADAVVDLNSGEVLSLVVTSRRRRLHSPSRLAVAVTRVREVGSTRLVVDGEAAAALRDTR
jgi:sporulation protein YlmC with PRC-barrel domain